MFISHSEDTLANAIGSSNSTYQFQPISKSETIGPMENDQTRLTRVGKLKQAIKECGSAAEFSRRHPKVDATYVSQLIKGHRAFGERAARKMESSVGWPTGYLDERDSHLDEKEGSYSIPRLDVTGSMGDGSDYPEKDTVIERMTLKGEWLRKVVPSRHIGDLAIISGKGNSMEPTFRDGDLLLVDTSIRAVDVDGVYVMSAHNRLFIKSVRQRIDGSFEISSDNPSVKTTDILDGSNPVDVHGRVVFAWNGRGL